MFCLFNSTSRASTNRRTMFTFPETEAGYKALWQYVTFTECLDPEDRQSYDFLTNLDPGEVEDHVHELCGTFNEYWGEYGWYLGVDDPDLSTLFVPADLEVVEMKEFRLGVNNPQKAAEAKHE